MTTIERIRLAGIACAGGGMLWVLVLMADVVEHETVYDGGTNYRIWEAFLVLIQVLLLIGVLGLLWSGATGSGRLGQVGLGMALLGRISFLAGEINSFIQGKDDEILVPLGAVLTATGMILAGIAVLRAGRWLGRRRYLPLAVGLYPFVAMFPIVAITGDPSILMISLWGFLWVVLGIALHAETRSAAWSHRPATASVYS
jgi:hypothetical protein